MTKTTLTIGEFTSSLQNSTNNLHLPSRTLNLSGRTEKLLKIQDIKKHQFIAQSWSEIPLGYLNALPTYDYVSTVEGITYSLVASAKLYVYETALSYITTRKLIQEAIRRGSYRSFVWFTQKPNIARLVLASLYLTDNSKVIHLPPESVSQADRVLKFIKERHGDWTLRALTTLGFLQREEERTNELFFSFDVKNSGMIANLNKVMKVASAEGLKCTALYYEARVRPLISCQNPNIQLRALSASYSLSVFRAATQMFPKIRTQILSGRLFTAESMILDDNEFLAQYISRSLSGIYAWQGLLDLLALQRTLTQIQPKAIFLASDSHRTSRMITLIAKSLGIRTIVSQHGAVVGDFAYVPLVADCMGAWGPWCARWFIDREVPPSKVVVTGNPRSARAEEVKVKVRESKYALLTTQPIDTYLTEELMGRVLESLLCDPNLQLKIRPHPGDSQRELLESIVNRQPLSVRQRVFFSKPHTSLADDLSCAFTVVTAQSTVGIDALAFGIPLILLSHSDIAEAIPYREFDCVLVARNAMEVSQALSSVRHEVTFNHLMSNAQTFLKAYISAHGRDAAYNLLSLASTPTLTP